LVTGNTGIDALLWMAKKPESKEMHQLLADINREKKRNILLTTHRRENWGKPMEEIFKAIVRLLKEYSDVRVRSFFFVPFSCISLTQVIFPVHLNPVVRSEVDAILAGTPGVMLLDPLPYDDLVQLMKHVYLILTDSGGIQEEGLFFLLFLSLINLASAFGIPILLLRENTERPEGIMTGVVKPIGTHEDLILTKFKEILDNEAVYANMSRKLMPFGDGHASKRIVQFLRGDNVEEFQVCPLHKFLSHFPIYNSQLEVVMNEIFCVQ